MRCLSIFVVILSVLTFGCASYQRLTPEQQEYLRRVEEEDTTFYVPSAKAEEAWGRSQSFLGRFSSMKLQIATDYVLQTYNPPKNEVEFGYNITRTPKGRVFEFTVYCSSGNMFYGKSAIRNSKILAYYIRTGELPYPSLIAR